MKSQVSNPTTVRPSLAAALPQLTMRSDLHAGTSADCSAGLSYWKNEYNSLKKYAQSLNCA